MRVKPRLNVKVIHEPAADAEKRLAKIFQILNRAQPAKGEVGWARRPNIAGE